DLRGIARARRLSAATMRNIRQNLFLAFVYNALGVPLAAGVFYPWLGFGLSPVVAAAAMSLSSVSVIANALRLRRAPLWPSRPMARRARAGYRPGREALDAAQGSRAAARARGGRGRTEGERGFGAGQGSAPRGQQGEPHPEPRRSRGGEAGGRGRGERDH